ncbi:MAG: hypothetical protein ABI539_05630, partial [Acidobacteriota bacterium]
MDQIMTIIKKTVPAAALLTLLVVLSAAGCSAQTEEQALQSIREMTRGGRVPPEDYIASIESRFAGKRTGALAKLLRAKIKYDNKDFTGAAALLDSDTFARVTKVADHALYLRGLAFQQAANYAEAVKVFSRLANEFHGSLRTREARLLWAESAVRTGSAADVPEILKDLIAANDADALLSAAKAFESRGDQSQAVSFFRRTYFYGAGSAAAKDAETKLLALSMPLTPQNADEIEIRANKLFDAKKYSEALAAYTDLAMRYPAAATPRVRLRRLTAAANARQMADAQVTFDSLPASAPEREEGYYQLVTGYARAKMWPQAHRAADEMRLKYTTGKLTPIGHQREHIKTP